MYYNNSYSKSVEQTHTRVTEPHPMRSGEFAGVVNPHSTRAKIFFKSTRKNTHKKTRNVRGGVQYLWVISGGQYLLKNKNKQCGRLMCLLS